MRARFVVAFSLCVLNVGAGNLPAQTPVDSPVASVQRLYRDYAWEAMFGLPPRGWTVLINEPRGVLRRYFSDSLSALIVRDRQCAARSGECNIDGSPIWDSNDPEAFDLDIEPAKDSAHVAVTFMRRYPPPNGTKVRLTYRMTHTPQGWRVADIIREGGSSFVAQLQRK